MVAAAGEQEEEEKLRIFDASSVEVQMAVQEFFADVVVADVVVAGVQEVAVGWGRLLGVVAYQLNALESQANLW